jgi:homoserine dehydrogenase
MSSHRVIRISFCGLGTVGQGVWKHLSANRAQLESRLGARLELHRVAVRSTAKARAVAIPAEKLCGDPLAVATDPKADIVCELMGGTGLAREVTLAALKLGKIVVSANKALLCEHGVEIFAAARKHGGHFLFEASVAGGIPIIKAIREGLVANRFKVIYGILNGTCNYMLTRMSAEGASYESILVDAKRLGYAEADEALDVEGWDTAHKASILAYLAHGIWVGTGQMIVQGINRLTQSDLRIAEQLGYRIKLLAVIARNFETNELSVCVHPTLLPKDKVLANVNGVFNGISVTGDVVGTTTYIGRGAGQDATASAVISDIADAVTLLTTGKVVALGEANAEFHERGVTEVKLAPLGHMRSRYYLRLTVSDEPGVLAQIASITARNQVSIASVIQSAAESRPDAASLILTTHESDERALHHTLAEFSQLGCILEQPLLLRIGDFTD